MSHGFPILLKSVIGTLLIGTLGGKLISSNTEAVLLSLRSGVTSNIEY